MPVNINSIRISLVDSVWHHDGIKSVAVIQEVTKRLQQMTQVRRSGDRQHGARVETFRPESVARPIRRHNGGVAEEPVGNTGGPDHICVHVHAPVLIQHVQPASNKNRSAEPEPFDLDL